MSLSTKCPIECPECHKAGEFERWDSINIDLDLELREKLFSGEIFTYRCPRCGHEMRLPSPILYHNMALKIMIFFEPFVPENGPEDFIEVPEGVENIWEEFTIRKVYGYYEFLEKISILERGLRDFAMERTKYMISHFIVPEWAEQNAHIFFMGVSAETEESPYGEMVIKAYKPDGEPWQSISQKMELYYENENTCKYDPRMQPAEKQVIVDKAWMEQQLTKL